MCNVIPLSNFKSLFLKTFRSQGLARAGTKPGRACERERRAQDQLQVRPAHEHNDNKTFT